MFSIFKLITILIFYCFRLAIVATVPEDYCVSNKRHLVGEMKMYFRHLETMGYTVVEVSEYAMMHKSNCVQSTTFIHARVHQIFLRSHESLSIAVNYF